MWPNGESSLGFNMSQAGENSRNYYQFRNESLSLDKHQNCYDHGMDSDRIFDVENTINFCDIQRKNFMNLPNPETNNIFQENESNSFSSDWEGYQSSSNRGLKSLAFLLLKTLRKKKLYSHKEIADEIQKRLLTKDREKNEVSTRQEKNIKRRIYDALNVMISAGLLERQMACIKITDKTYTVQKNYSVVNRKKECQDEIQEISLKINKKKELLATLKSKQEALKDWYSKKLEDKDQTHKLQFPFIVIIQKQENQKLLKPEIETNSFFVRNKNLEILSQTDLIEQFYRKNNPVEEQIINDFSLLF